jgi:shikimate kinase
MRLVFLYGPPGVGKLTVGRELAALTGFKLFHNHLDMSAVQAVFPKGTESWNRLVGQLWIAVLVEAARAGVDLVMTWAHGAGEDVARRYAETVESNGGRVLLVRLVAEPDVLAARVVGEDRRALGKLTDPAALPDLLDGRHRPRPLPFGRSLTVDTTALAPREAALRIAEQYDLPRIG